MNDAHGSPQSVFVLGGTSEIGRAIVRRLVARRARTIVLAGRDVDALRRTANELSACGATTVDVVPFEATDPSSHPALVDDVFARHGEIDLVLVAFGILGDQAAAEKDPSVAVEVGMVNYVAAMSVGLAVAARLREQGSGTLVALSSVAAERARRANFVYGSSKAGMDAFFQGLGDSLQGSGARVIVVRPGFVHGRMTEGMDPAPFATTPDAVGDAVVAALGTAAATVWVPGPLRWLMAGLRHAPRPLFRRIAS